jgi:hypothetical protein
MIAAGVILVLVDCHMRCRRLRLSTQAANFSVGFKAAGLWSPVGGQTEALEGGHLVNTAQQQLEHFWFGFKPKVLGDK